MNLVTEIQYFPPVILFKTSFDSTNIIFDQYESFRKMSFRNRTLIAGANGIITLSIPLLNGRDQRRPTKEVRIANDIPWQARHWKSITSAYNRSPWFEFYGEELHELYHKSYEFLIDWNLSCYEWIAEKLGKSPLYQLTDHYQRDYDPAHWMDWRNKVLPKNYKEFEPVRYRQVFEERNGFYPNLSILDLLFCAGATPDQLQSALPGP